MPKIVVSKEDWLWKGAEYFARGGAETLPIEAMARELGASKSSFYWYFDNRETFIREMVEAWVQRTTGDVIALAEAELQVEEQIDRILDAMFATTRGHGFMIQLRRLGEREPSYKERLARIEQQRIDYMAALLMKWGMTQEEAGRRSYVLYHFYLGWLERHSGQEQSGETTALIALVREIIIHPRRG